MADIPHDTSKPFTINGITFANREEYEKRLERDLMQLAELLYDIYQEKKLKEQKDIAR